MAGETFGKYLVIRRLAMGGMAEVALARLEGAAGFNKLVVVKHVLPHLAQDPDFIDMFLDEGRLAARLMHPNIAQTFELGESDGRYFMAMEYVRGKTLTELFRRARELQVKVPMAVALRVAMLLLEALQYAHALKGDDGKPLGLVHRDVSPGNVMVTFDGAVKLLDFGIAKAVTQSHHTEAGRVKGKAGFMSPEQCRGLALDARSDLYSAGAILYQLVTGARPFESQVSSSELYALMLATLKGGFDLPTALRPELPPELDTIILKAMALEVGDRYPSAAPLLVELEALCARLGTFPSAQRLADLMDQLFGDDERGELWFDPDAAARAAEPSQVAVAVAPSYPGARGPAQRARPTQPAPAQRDPARPPPPPPPDPEPRAEEPSVVEASAVLLSVDPDDEQATQAFPPMDLEDDVATRAFPPMDLSAEVLARTELPPRRAAPPNVAPPQGGPARLHASTATALAQEASSLRSGVPPAAAPTRAQPAPPVPVAGPEAARLLAPTPPPANGAPATASPSPAKATAASPGAATEVQALPSVVLSPSLTQAPALPPKVEPAAPVAGPPRSISRLPAAAAAAAIAALAAGALWWNRPPSSAVRGGTPQSTEASVLAERGATGASPNGAAAANAAGGAPTSAAAADSAARGAPTSAAATDTAARGAPAAAATTDPAARGTPTSAPAADTAARGAPTSAAATGAPTAAAARGAPTSAAAADSAARAAPTSGAATDAAARGAPTSAAANGAPTSAPTADHAARGAPTSAAATDAAARGAPTPTAATDTGARGTPGATTATAANGSATPGAPGAPSTGMGQLKLDAYPWAYVSWHGKTLGETPVSTQLPAGEQVLTLTNPELKMKRTVKLTIKARAVTTHFERFETKAP